MALIRIPGASARATPRALLCVTCWSLSCAGTPGDTAPVRSGEEPRRPDRGRVRVISAYPHDPEAFTQGLLYHDGHLFESTGLEGRSSLRLVELATGRVLREVRLPPEDFAEGLALGGRYLVQLTWKQGKAYRWNPDDFQLEGVWSFAGEGWGLTFDGKSWIQSDGSSTLTLRDPATFAARGTLEVRSRGVAVAYLNELEWARGSLFANVWMSDWIVEIDPTTGDVLAEYDLGGLLPLQERARADVLNGIAWNPGTDRFYVTGKFWPQLFEIELDRSP